MSVNRFRKDNRGSAFIAVLVSVLFIGIIAAIVIFISRTNIENSRTSIASTDNFYEGEVALDELKDSLKGIAEEAIVEAYKKWLQEYTLVNAADQTKKFNELFSESFQDKVKDYFKITGIATPEGGYKDYKELMYDVADETLVKTGASETTPEYSIDTETGTVTISDVSVLQKDENNNTTRISTDLILSIKTPSVELGTSRGVNNNIKDYILIADGEIRLSGAGTNQTIIGDIYGGGKLEGDTNGVYTGSGLLLDNAKNVMLYSDHIITRSSIRTQNGSILNVFGKNQYGYGAWDWAYSEIWAKNLVMDGSGSSIMKIQGSCNIADDLSIDSNNSEFKLMGDQSTYYGYNTSSNGNDAETSSSIVINGKNVNLDLTSASMLWLAGKSYVEVPSVWGYKKNNTASIGGTNIDVKSSTFMQGESISYRSLQSSYLLPGDCIVGIYHNPMTKAEFDTIKANSKEAFDSLDDAARAGASYIDLSKGVANNGINLEQYLDYASPYYKTEVQYGTTSSDILVYLYMNFANPNMAATYFQNYNNQLPDLVSSKITMAESGTRMLVNETGSSTDPATNEILLNKSRVVNTGNILVYDGSAYKLYGKNSNYYDNEITRVKNSKKMEFQGLYTSLNKSLMGNKTKDLTDMLVVYNYFTAASSENKDKAIKILENTIPVTFSVDGTTEMRDAYMVGGSGDIWIMADGIHYGSEGGPKDPAGVIKAGIIIANGDIHVKCDSFWGTLIAKGNIIIDQSCDLRASSEYVSKVIQSNMIVTPYFTENAGSSTDGIVNAGQYLDIEYKNWKKE